MMYQKVAGVLGATYGVLAAAQNGSKLVDICWNHGSTRKYLGGLLKVPQF